MKGLRTAKWLATVLTVHFPPITNKSLSFHFDKSNHLASEDRKLWQQEISLWSYNSSDTQQQLFGFFPAENKLTEPDLWLLPLLKWIILLHFNARIVGDAYAHSLENSGSRTWRDILAFTLWRGSRWKTAERNHSIAGLPSQIYTELVLFGVFAFTFSSCVSSFHDTWRWIFLILKGLLLFQQRHKPSSLLIEGKVALGAAFWEVIVSNFTDELC